MPLAISLVICLLPIGMASKKTNLLFLKTQIDVDPAPKSKEIDPNYFSSFETPKIHFLNK